VGQLGFYDLDKRLKAISAKGDPLEALNAIVPFESFRAEIEAVVRLAPEARKSNAGRKPFDVVMMFKVLVLQTLYNLADEQVEYQIRDRLSFMRFLGLGLEDTVPDATTVWLFREALTKANLVKALFERFDGYLNAKGYIARGGQIVDATIVSAPKQHNSREENEAIKAGKTPEGWEDKPAKTAQKDKDARWTKKNDKSFYGYKNHISIDRRHTSGSAATPRPTPRCMTARSSMRCWTKPTPVARCGPTAPTGRSRPKPGSRRRATRAASIAAEPATIPSPSANRPPTPHAHGCAPASSTSLVTSRTPWAASSCAPSAWRVRAPRSGS
jgi:transposase